MLRLVKQIACFQPHIIQIHTSLSSRPQPPIFTAAKMAATTLFSTPISIQHNPSFNKSPKLPLIRASTTVEEEENTQSKTIPLGGCKACGKAAIEKGCNGEGRIQGGIATVPGFGWWPIKAYRPCPDFVATGGRYRRQGQSMDEVAGFGTVPRTSTTAETQSSNKEGPRKFKR